MRTQDICQRFENYFRMNGHTVVPSAPLVLDDPDLLFVNAGMVQFKPYFLGQAPAPWPRATSLQKCVRTGDIDDVGKVSRYNTFFQMAGNFSFGDYFREQAITYAWDLLTRPVADGGYALDPGRLWVTVYQDDDEAVRLWRRIAGIPDGHIQRLGMADNFWSMGVPGPCGPCSEIFFDRGPRFGRDGGPAVDTDRFLEIWNLVFMQNVRGAGTGKDEFPILGDLPAKNVDTGLGVERAAVVLQDVDTVYETDLVRPVISTTEQLAGRRYGRDRVDDVRFRVIADHARSSVMLISDGVTPGNEARGYVLRRLLRRIVRSVRLLGVAEPVLGELAAVVRDSMSEGYPVVADDFARIAAVMRNEEETFLGTLAGGSKIFDIAAADTKAAGGSAITGAKAFQLHDTYGFPIDLTLEMAAEQGLSVDQDGFTRLMGEQRARAKADARTRKTGHGDQTVYRELLGLGATEFTGYHELVTEATVRGVIKDGQRVGRAAEGEVVELVLDRTPLYAESGGQDSDAGVISADGLELRVEDVQKVARRLWVHRVSVRAGEVAEGMPVVATVDTDWRLGARQAHSGTHVVHAALRQVLGPSAVQSGSYNKPGYLRLDFAWQSALSAATRSEIDEVANLALRDDLPVKVMHTSLAEAREMGALALFGETYDETVRVVEIGGPWSRELCGGTHVRSSAQVGSIVLTGEASIGSGVRRLEAFVGMEAFRHLAKERTLVQNLAVLLKSAEGDVYGRVESLVTRLRLAEKELERLRRSELVASAGRLAADAQPLGDVTAVVHALPEGVAGGDLRALANEVRQKLADRPGVVVLSSVTDGAVGFVAATTAGARDRGLAANDLVRAFALHVGGRGGGKPDFAQGAAGAPDRLDRAMALLRRDIVQQRSQ